MKTGRSFLLTITTVFFILCSPLVALSSQVNIADIAVTPSEAPQVGVPLTVTVNASSSDESPVYYKFYYCANYGTSAYTSTPWTVVQNYSTSNTAQYTFNQAGKYIIVVRAVTDTNNEPAALPIVGHVVDVGGTSDVTLTGLSRNPSTSVTVGETVQFTANAVTYLNDVIYYKFYYCANYGTDTYATTAWTMVQDYSTLNTCDYTFPATGDYIVVVRAVTDPNNEPAALPIVGQVVNVKDEVISCTYSISPASGGFTSDSGTASVTVTASSSSCSWITSNSLSWVSLSPTSGTGSGSVTITVTANTGTTRSGSVTIASQTYTISQEAASSPSSCGAYVAPGIWKEFDCYNLAAIGKTTNDDPFTPSWRLIGGYWQWGRKGPDSSQWYDTNTSNFAYGPTGPGQAEANSGAISRWSQTYAPNGSWSDSHKTANDPCPAGYRVPTYTQWDGVINNNTQSIVGTWTISWNTHANYNAAWFFGGNLMLPAAGSRTYASGSLAGRGSGGAYWSSTESGSANAWELDSDATMSNYFRRGAHSVRCIAE